MAFLLEMLSLGSCRVITIIRPLAASEIIWAAAGTAIVPADLAL